MAIAFAIQSNYSEGQSSYSVRHHVVDAMRIG